MTIAEKKQNGGGYAYLIDWIIKIGDILLINVFFIILYYGFSTRFVGEAGLSYENKIKGLLLINLAYFIASSIIRTKITRNIINIDKIIEETVYWTIFYTIVLTALFSLFHILQVFLLQVFIWAFSLGIILIIWHVIFRWLVKSYRSKGYNYRSVIIIGGGLNGANIYKQLESSEFGYRILGFFDDNLANREVLPGYLGTISDISDFIAYNNVDEIYCTLPGSQDAKIMELITLSEKNMIRLYLVPEFHKYIKRRFTFHVLDTMPVLSLRYEPLEHLSNRIIKRTFDIVFSLIVLITIFPIIYTVFGIAIKLSSPGPIFFKQLRTGFKGQEFYCYKFRSMRINNDAHAKSATQNDPRVTKIGLFMRKTSIDELPQFINVLKGEMSIVGPRPHMLKHTEDYSTLIDKFMVRHLVKPGITGWAQVTGFRGETKELVDMENRVVKDVWYLENWTFFLDIKIILKTIFNAFKGEEKAY